MIPENEKWQAVVSCDSSFDNRFFYGVRTTGIFCRPSCRSKTPARENITFFSSAASAIDNGFRPCKRCRPDKAIFAPESELVQKTRAFLDESFHQDLT